jgi:ferritin
MIAPIIVDEINKQIQREYANAYAYKGVALYFESLNLHGISRFMFQQDKEEQEHADKLIKHLVDRGGNVTLGALPLAATSYDDPLQAALTVKGMEEDTTSHIHELYALAQQQNDYALQVLLHWFIEEQVEELAWSAELAELMGQFSAHPGQLHMLDHHWGKRVK